MAEKAATRDDGGDGAAARKPARYGAKALIFDGERLLALKKQGEIGTYYVLPGGGQEPGELLVEALVRECREELGARIEPGRLRYLQEYRGDRHEFRDAHGGLHFVNVYFEARLLDDPGTLPLSPDTGQVGWEWLPIASLAAVSFYPKALAARLTDPASGTEPAYLGDSV